MTVHELSQLVLEWIWARPNPLHKTLSKTMYALVLFQKSLQCLRMSTALLSDHSKYPTRTWYVLYKNNIDDLICARTRHFGINKVPHLLCPKRTPGVHMSCASQVARIWYKSINKLAMSFLPNLSSKAYVPWVELSTASIQVAPSLKSLKDAAIIELRCWVPKVCLHCIRDRSKKAHMVAQYIQ
jgi:hypothetical protein